MTDSKQLPPELQKVQEGLNVIRLCSDVQSAFHRIAMDSIALINAYAEKLAAQAGWISVKERLPEKDVPVLGFWKDGMQTATYDGGSWYENAEYGITYKPPLMWRDLPAAPKVNHE